MRPSRPPGIARWMLDHLVAGGRDEGLAGDLAEEFHSGRSSAWYWRQVFSVIALGLQRAGVRYVGAALFALAWSMLAPAWLLIVARMEKDADLTSIFYRMDWPWSTICDLGLLLIADLAFIWIGIVLFQAANIFPNKKLGVRPVRRGVAASIPVLMLVSAALISVPKYFIDVQTAGRFSLGPVSSYAITRLDPAEVRRLAPREEWSAQFGSPVIQADVDPVSKIMDFQRPTMMVRLPFFFVVLVALWRANRSERNEQDKIPS